MLIPPSFDIGWMRRDECETFSLCDLRIWQQSLFNAVTDTGVIIIINMWRKFFFSCSDQIVCGIFLASGYVPGRKVRTMIWCLQTFSGSIGNEYAEPQYKPSILGRQKVSEDVSHFQRRHTPSFNLSSSSECGLTRTYYAQPLCYKPEYIAWTGRGPAM
jgi:hypothetical protein